MPDSTDIVHVVLLGLRQSRTALKNSGTMSSAGMILNHIFSKDAPMNLWHLSQSCTMTQVFVAQNNVAAHDAHCPLCSRDIRPPTARQAPCHVELSSPGLGVTLIALRHGITTVNIQPVNTVVRSHCYIFKSSQPHSERVATLAVHEPRSARKTKKERMALKTLLFYLFNLFGVHCCSVSLSPSHTLRSAALEPYTPCNNRG